MPRSKIIHAKRSVFEYFHLVVFAMFTLFTSIFLLLTFNNAQTKFKREALALERQYIDTKKKLLHKEVDQFIDFIEMKKVSVRKETQTIVHDRVNEAYQIAQSIYETYKERLPKETIEKKIIETLRIMRYQQGEGYYFITRLDGVEMLFADKPEMEGKNLLSLKNADGRYVIQEMIALIKEQKEGLYEYAWSKPNEAGEHFEKVAYLKLFEPFGWFIGTGLYLDEVEKRVKEEIVNDKSRLFFDKETNNYIFIGTWDGVSLTHPAKGKNMYEVQDLNGKYIVQALIEEAKKGGGYVEYVMPPLQGERNRVKLSYVESIDAWQWYVGAGVYLEDISAEIALLQQKIDDELKESIVFILSMVLAFSVVLTFFYIYISRKIGKDLNAIIDFFDSLVNKETMIDRSTIRFHEFDRLAEHANAMLASKIQINQDLERYKTIVSNSDDLLAFIDKEYRYLAVSNGYIHFFDAPKDKIIGYSLPELFGKEYFEKELKSSSDRVLNGESYEKEYWVRSPNGEYHFMHAKYVPYYEASDEKPSAYIVSAHDITDKKINEEKLIASEKELSYLAHNDLLTGLPNRLLLHDRIKHAIAHCKRENLILGVCFIDLDNFKKINDTFGHSYGDEILKQFATRMSAMVRSCDTLSRIGGDEFVLVVEKIKEVDEIERIVSKIESTFDVPFFVKEQKFFLSASIGISLYPEHGLESETLIKNADAAMYKAKDKGKNTYAFYSLEMTIASYERIGMENALREAVLQKEFEVYYQPQIDLKTGSLCGVEALVRWNHPKEGVLAPSRFITLCEETRLIVELGTFVLRQASLDIMTLTQEYGFQGTVSVNVSGVQIEYSHFLKTLHDVIHTTGIDPSLLEMEITESFIMNDPERWIELLKNMQILGVKIAIDDFGTGHSSLSYLRKLPIDKLKVDMSFVKDVPEYEDACAIVTSIIQLAHTMKIVTLAEGIETKAQENYLKKQKCVQGQGYLYAKPMSLDAFKLWIMQRQK